MNTITRSKITDSPFPPELHNLSHAEAMNYPQAKWVMRNKPPKGFWYQIGNSWEEWCAYNQPNWLHDYRLPLEVDVSRFAVIESTKDLTDFSAAYGISNGFGTQEIDWKRVMEDYDGIEMPAFSYGWPWLEGCEWVYGWDVASGVCWNARKCVKVLEAQPREKQEPCTV